MILDLNQKSDGISIGVSGLEMGIDLSDPEKIFYILSQGFYVDSLRAIIQEISSNILDSYIPTDRNILDYPGYIILTKDSIVFKDSGEGISPERMEKIMSKFFASTKTKDSLAIGNFGLGFKSIFSFTNQFTVQSIFGGVKRSWVFSKEVGKIEISLVGEQETDEMNGSSFIISINNPKEWYNKVVSTIPYFKGIIFDCQLGDYWNHSKEFNEKKIIEGNHFYWRDVYNRNLQLCLDQVLYEIPWGDLGFEFYSVNFPFGVKFRMDEGLLPNPSREKIVLNEDAKEKIKNRIKDVINELHQYHTTEKQHLYEFLDSPSTFLLEIGEVKIELKTDVNQLCLALGVRPFRTINPVFDKIIGLEGKKYSFYDFLNFERRISENGIRKNRYNSYDVRNKIVYDGVITAAISRYLREKFEGYTIVSVKKKRKLWGNNGYHHILGLGKIPKGEWRTIIKTWQDEQQVYLDLILKFDPVDYKEWLSNQQRVLGIKRKLETGEVVVKNLTEGLRKMVLKREVIKLSDRGWWIYSDDSSRLYQYFKLGLRCVEITEKEQVKIWGNKKFIKVEDWEKSKGFKRRVDKTHLRQLWSLAGTRSLRFLDRINKCKSKLFLEENKSYFNYLPSQYESLVSPYIKSYVEKALNMIENYPDGYNSREWITKKVTTHKMNLMSKEIEMLKSKLKKYELNKESNI